MYVSYADIGIYLGHDCSMCTTPFKRSRRVRNVVIIENDAEQVICVAHNACFDKIKTQFNDIIIPHCCMCGEHCDMSENTKYSRSRVCFSKAHDDELICNSCMLTEVQTRSQYVPHAVNTAISRGFKRSMEENIIQDQTACKKMKLLQNDIKLLSMEMRAIENMSVKSQLFLKFEQKYDEYDAYMLAKYKKHMMDACIKEMMEKIWHPANYHRWRHLT
jgi:hypothetical protein